MNGATIFVMKRVAATVVAVVAVVATSCAEPRAVDPVRHTGASLDWVQHQKLVAPDGAPGDFFGFASSLSGNTVLIGAEFGESAYAFVRSGATWSQQAKLTASDGAPGHTFGSYVSLDGDTALVGAVSDSAKGTASGSVYAFVRSGTSWSEQAKLTASDGATYDYFGVVSLDGDQALIGASGDDDNGSWSGSAYVFVRAGTKWFEQAKLVPADGVASAYFGASVWLSGDTALVGALADNDPSTGPGSVYVFARTGTSWSQTQKLTASDGMALAGFGTSIAVDGDTAVISAFGANGGVAGTGAAYVFTRTGTTWSEQAKLQASNAAAGDHVGESVALDSDTALLGAPYHDGQGFDSGGVYVFKRSGTTWSETQELGATDTGPLDHFGSSLALGADLAVVGAHSANGAAGATGSAYVFALEPDGGIGSGGAAGTSGAGGAAGSAAGGSAGLSMGGSAGGLVGGSAGASGSATGGALGSESGGSGDDGSCGCRVVGGERNGGAGLLLLALGLALARLTLGAASRGDAST